MSPNLTAFLATIAWSEGTDRPATQPSANHGYDVLVGGANFSDYSRHPNKLVHLNAHLESTAAGRYQILYRYWAIYQRQLHLPDFGPDSQDAYAVQIIKECHALEDVEAGRIPAAIAKCAHIWASFPGAGYGQNENGLAPLLLAYTKAGGKLAS